MPLKIVWRPKTERLEEELETKRGQLQSLSLNRFKLPEPVRPVEPGRLPGWTSWLLPKPSGKPLIDPISGAPTGEAARVYGESALQMMPGIGGLARAPISALASKLPAKITQSLVGKAGSKVLDMVLGKSAFEPSLADEPLRNKPLIKKSVKKEPTPEGLTTPKPLESISRPLEAEARVIPPAKPPARPPQPTVAAATPEKPLDVSVKVQKLLTLAKPIRSIQEVARHIERIPKSVRMTEKIGKAGSLEEATKVFEKGKLPSGGEEFYLKVKDLPEKMLLTPQDELEMLNRIRNFPKWEKLGYTQGNAAKAALKLKNVVSGKVYTTSDLPTASEAKLLGEVFGKEVEQALANINLTKLQKASSFLTTLYYNSILSGPRTHIINALSNTFSSLLSPIERAGAAIVEKGLAKVSRRPQERFIGEAAQDTFGLLRGIPEGVRAALKSWKDMPIEAIEKYEMNRFQFKGKAKILGWPSRLLEMGDTMGRGINTSAALRAEAYRMGRASGLSGDKLAKFITDASQHPTEELLTKASQIAEYRLFRAPAGEWASKIMGLRDWQIPGLGIQPLRFIIPFVRTPANLLKYGLERSPLAIFNPKLWQNIVKKSPEASDQIAKWLIGSSVAAAVAIYVADDKITGAAPTSPAERDRFYREGKQPYSVKIGNTWVSYQRLEPLNQAIGQVAAVVDGIKHGKNPGDAAKRAGLTIGENFVSQTYMSSIADLIDAIEDPERYGDQWANRMATGMSVPYSALTRTVEQQVSPEIEQPQNVGQSIQSAIPGVSGRVPKKLTAMGEVSKRETPAWSPINVTTEKGTLLNKELNRLKVNIGFVSGTVNGRVLTAEEKRRYQTLAGNLIKISLSRLIVSREYRYASEDNKRKLIDRAADKAREAAREQLFPEKKKTPSGGLPAIDRLKLPVIK